MLCGQVGNGGINKVIGHRTVARSHVQARGITNHFNNMTTKLLSAAVETSIYQGGWWSGVLL
jgi:hypothetical protein